MKAHVVASVLFCAAAVSMPQSVTAEEHAEKPSRCSEFPGPLVQSKETALAIARAIMRSFYKSDAVIRKIGTVSVRDKGDYWEAGLAYCAAHKPKDLKPNEVYVCTGSGVAFHIDKCDGAISGFVGVK